MKKILLLSALIISLNSFGQYIVNQSLGSDSTLVTSKGALKSRIINKVFTDTTQANTQRIKFYDGAQIITITGGNKFWIRDSTLNKWVRVGEGIVTASQGLVMSGNDVRLGDLSSNNGATFSGTRSINGHQTSPVSGLPLLRFDSLVFMVTNMGGETIVSRQGYTKIAANVADRAYTQYFPSPGRIYSFALDSISFGAGGAPSASPTYLSLYPTQVYLASTTGRMILGAGTYADQYAVDSLIWRMEDRSSFFLLNPGVAEIYAGTAEIELELDDINLDADSIRTIRAANVKPIADSAGWYMKIRNRATGTEADAYWPAGGGGSVPINTLANATGDGTVEVGDNLLTWNFTGLTTNGMSLVSSSTAAGESSILHRVSVSGTNASSSRTTLAGSYSNSHAGTGAINYGLQLSATNGATNVALDIANGVVRINPITASQLVGTDASKNLVSVPTITNTRWTARVGSTTSSGTPTINTDATDIYKLTAQAADITSMTTNLSGTPVDGDILEIQITDNGTARAITWGASFVASSVALPTTTVISTTLTTIFQYYTTSSYGNNKWVCASYY